MSKSKARLYIVIGEFVSIGKKTQITPKVIKTIASREFGLGESVYLHLAIRNEDGTSPRSLEPSKTYFLVYTKHQNYFVWDQTNIDLIANFEPILAHVLDLIGLKTISADNLFYIAYPKESELYKQPLDKLEKGVIYILDIA